MSSQSHDPSHACIHPFCSTYVYVCFASSPVPLLGHKGRAGVVSLGPLSLLVSADLTAICSADPSTGGSTGSRPRAWP